MGISLTRISKYEAENREIPAESRGTKHMINNWRDKYPAEDQIAELCKVLRKAGLREEASDLSGVLKAVFNHFSNLNNILYK